MTSDDALPEAPASANGPQTDSPQLEIRLVLHVKTLQRILVGGIVALTLAGLGAEIADELNWRDPYAFVEFFGLSYEENLPTWYSSMLLFSCALALTFISLAKRRSGAPYRTHWWLLAGVFSLMSLDEIAQKHEEISNFFDYDGVLYFGWVIPAAIFVTLFGLAYVRFLLHLPRRTAVLMATSGAIYVFGALVMELPLGYWTDQQGQHNLIYGMIDLVEESLEIVGLSLFLYTLLGYLAEHPVSLEARRGGRAKTQSN